MKGLSSQRTIEIGGVPARSWWQEKGKRHAKYVLEFFGVMLILAIALWASE